MGVKKQTNKHHFLDFFIFHRKSQPAAVVVRLRLALSLLLQSAAVAPRHEETMTAAGG